MAFGFLDAIPLVGGVLGQMDAQRRLRNSQAEAQKLIDAYSGQAATDYSNLLGQNQRGLYGATGLTADAIAQLGRSLGSSLAGAGVTNSSATAGALANAQRSGQSALADLAAQNAANALNFKSGNDRYILGQRLGLQNNAINDAREQLGGTQSGLMSALGTLTQKLLAENRVPRANQTQGTRGPGYTPPFMDLFPQYQLRLGGAPAVAGMGSVNYNKPGVTNNQYKLDPMGAGRYQKPMLAYGF